MVTSGRGFLVRLGLSVLPYAYQPTCLPAYWYCIYIGLGYTSNTCSGVMSGLSFL